MYKMNYMNEFLFRHPVNAQNKNKNHISSAHLSKMNYFLILKLNIFCKLDKCILQIEHKHILQHGQSQQRPDGKKIQNKEQVAPSVAVSDLRSILRAGQEKITKVKLALFRQDFTRISP